MQIDSMTAKLTCRSNICIKGGRWLAGNLLTLADKRPPPIEAEIIINRVITLEDNIKW